MLRASLGKALGAFTLNVAFEVARGGILVLTGENGSGKTTVLRLLAGLARPDSGRVELGGACYSDGARVLVPAWERDIGYVPQDAVLLPHLSARANVGFGLRARGVARAGRDARVGEVVEVLGIAAFADRRPHELSGGQQQRVALARALVLEPRLLLLDEPLSALDAASRDVLRAELRRLLAGRDGVTLFVTHSADEARVVGDDVLTMREGGGARLPAGR